MNMWQGGLGLPEREYYLAQDAQSKQIRTDYINHIKNVFVLMGIDEAKATANANTILTVETAMAKPDGCTSFRTGAVGIESATCLKGLHSS